MAVTFYAVTGAALAGPPESPRNEPSPSIFSQYRESKERLRYLSDLTHVKNATLESEAVFFDRLEKQKKIEDVRLDARSAAGDLKGIRNRLSAAELVLLEQADDLFARMTEPLEDTGSSIDAARYELRKYHDRTTAGATAIAAGRLDAAPLVSSIRRMIKVAERSLQTLAFRLPRAQDELDAARKIVAKVLEETKADDPQRELLVECQRSVDAAAAELNRFSSAAADLITLLQTTRRDYFPECAYPPTAQRASPTNNGQARLADGCHDVSLALLNKSAPALAELEQAMAQHSNMAAAFERARDARQSAVKYLEMAQAVTNPAHDKLRGLQTKANELLERAEDQLLETKRLLVEDVPGETAQCAQCGDLVIRTRRVIDPACTCAKSNIAMLEAENLIRQAKILAEQIGEELDDLNVADDSIRRIRGPEGVLYKLARALERGEEFRKQEFDILPGDTTPRIPQEMPIRNFPPMVATYVARQSWHYPVYFEDIALERYGHHHGCLQPFVSYGKFLADLAMLPYNVCLDPPCCVQYDLGLYRPGDEVPHLIYVPRPDCKAALFEAAVWTGLMFTP